MKRVLLVILLSAVAGAAFDKPQPQPTLLKRPNQTVDLTGLTVPAPAQKCENFGWAAGLESILRMQGVPLDQKYWVTKMEGGELCQTQLRSLEDLAQVIDG